jgi:sugar-phosphatase
MKQAVIFDMDGLLIDSEPLWKRVEYEVFRPLGLVLSPRLNNEITGLRVDELVQLCYDRHPWTGPSRADVVDQLVQGVVALIRNEGAAKPGVAEVVAAARGAGLRLALASSSCPVIINAALDRLELHHTFEVVHSAEGESHGKPHPAVYLTAAAKLGVPPQDCLAVEDSLNGVVAAKAARMAVIAVPEVNGADRAPFALADAVVDSLHDIDTSLLSQL